MCCIVKIYVFLKTLTETTPKTEQVFFWGVLLLMQALSCMCVVMGRGLKLAVDVSAWMFWDLLKFYTCLGFTQVSFSKATLDQDCLCLECIPGRN